MSDGSLTYQIAPLFVFLATIIFSMQVCGKKKQQVKSRPSSRTSPPPHPPLPPTSPTQGLETAPPESTIVLPSATPGPRWPSSDEMTNSSAADTTTIDTTKTTTTENVTSYKIPIPKAYHPRGYQETQWHPEWGTCCGQLKETNEVLDSEKVSGKGDSNKKTSSSPAKSEKEKADEPKENKQKQMKKAKKKEELKPKEMPMTYKEQLIAAGMKTDRRNYQTMEDVESDWSSLRKKKKTETTEEKESREKKETKKAAMDESRKAMKTSERAAKKYEMNN